MLCTCIDTLNMTYSQHSRDAAAAECSDSKRATRHAETPAQTQVSGFQFAGAHARAHVCARSLCLSLIQTTFRNPSTRSNFGLQLPGAHVFVSSLYVAHSRTHILSCCPNLSHACACACSHARGRSLAYPLTHAHTLSRTHTQTYTHSPSPLSFFLYCRA